jgi:hypothetical protein
MRANSSDVSAPDKIRAVENRWDAGHAVAVFASFVLLADTVLLVVLGGGLLAQLTGGTSSSDLVQTALPAGIYAAWAMGVFGSIAAIVAIVLYGFRARWFWRCLLIASATWLIFPPIHAVIGIIALVLLIRFRFAFPKRVSEVRSDPS